jgi:hypothetical protein
MKPPNTHIEPWEKSRKFVAPWPAGTYLGAAVWSLLVLGLSFTYVSLFTVGLWYLDVSSRNSANSSGEPHLRLTRAEVLQNFWPLWWPLTGVLCWFGIVLFVTWELFDSSSRQSRRFSWGLASVCALVLLGWWLTLALDIWQKYGAPPPS